MRASHEWKGRHGAEVVEVIVMEVEGLEKVKEEGSGDSGGGGGGAAGGAAGAGAGAGGAGAGAGAAGGGASGSIYRIHILIH